MAYTKRELKKLVKQLEKVRGRHTELVSVYVPAGYDLNKVISHLREEQGTAKNIKDAKTRGNVIDSLEKSVRLFREINRTPENGVALFAGNVSVQENKIDIEAWAVEPPEPLNIRMYRCDQKFVLDPLRSMMEHKHAYGLVVMDRREASIGFLKGPRIEMTSHLTSGVPGKFRAGGQSAQRFDRLIEGMALEFYRRIADRCKEEFLGLGNDLKGILVGGPGPTKEAFVEQLNNELKKKIVAIQDLTYTDESGLHDLVEKSQDAIANEVIVEEKKIMQKFFDVLAKEPSRAGYGKDDVLNKIKMGAADLVLISEDIDDEVFEEFEILAGEYGTKVKAVSVETREGKQLIDLGGFAVILRYAVAE
jgi:peptide chain release factor subunit 1